MFYFWYKMAINIMSLCLLVATLSSVLMCAKCILPYEVNDQILAKYPLPDLPYDYDALVPYIDEATMRVHHTGHLVGYTSKLNGALAQWRLESPDDKLASSSVLSILENLQSVPEKYQTLLRNVGGGFVNHNLYFSIMSANSSDDFSSIPVGRVADLINKEFGSFKKLKDRFSSRANALFGSGYVWLCQEQTKGKSSLKLSVVTTANQDAPMTEGLQPILILDVWEHAYYLNHQYRRVQYVQDWWNVVNWQAVQGLSDWWLKRSSSDHDEL